MINIFVTDIGYDDSIKKVLREKIGINQTAFKINYIESIPKNKSGKVMYSKLNENESWRLFKKRTILSKLWR